MQHKRAIGAIVLGLITWAGTLEAQTRRAAERRADRNARQTQREIARGNYFAPDTWAQINPWIEQYKIAPVQLAANAAAQVVDSAIDAADGSRNNRYGFSDPNPDPNVAWFYDYYTYGPTFYYGEQNADRYYGAIRYFDVNNDGIFDSHAYYRDSDNDGIYDAYNRLDFGDATVRSTPPAAQQSDRQARTVASAEEASQEEVYAGPGDARRYRVEGKIEMTKSAKVNGKETLVVRVMQQNNESMAVDLGPSENMRGRQVEIGQMLSASGPLHSIGEKTILMADEVTIDGNSIAIERSTGSTLSGTLVNVRETELATGMHYLAVVEVDGKRHMVDLGAASLYEQPLQPQLKVTIRGVPIESRGYPVLIAERVQVGDRVVTVNSKESFSF